MKCTSKTFELSSDNIPSESVKVGKVFIHFSANKNFKLQLARLINSSFKRRPQDSLVTKLMLSSIEFQDEDDCEVIKMFLKPFLFAVGNFLLRA